MRSWTNGQIFTDPIEKASSASDFRRSNMDMIVEVNLALLEENRELFEGVIGLDVCGRVHDKKNH